MTQKTNLFNGVKKKMLHVAPESQLSRLFQEADCIDYLSVDLSSPTAMVRMDITDIQYPDGSFDVIYCSHVLEHVSDDKRAMRELHRVLKPGGWAILQVPISGDETFEDPTVTSPEAREQLFGQDDHLRQLVRTISIGLLRSQTRAVRGSGLWVPFNRAVLEKRNGRARRV